MLQTQLEHTDKMTGNWPLPNDAQIKDAFWPEFQNAVLGPQGREDRARRRRARGRPVVAARRTFAEPGRRPDGPADRPHRRGGRSARISFATQARRARPCSSGASSRPRSDLPRSTGSFALGWNLVLSFQDWSPLRPADWVGLDHYQEMFFHDDVFWQACGTR